MTFCKHLSLIGLMQEAARDDSKKADLLIQLERIYSLRSEKDSYEDLARQLENEYEKPSDTPVGLGEAMCSGKYRFATWNGVILGMFQQTSGISTMLLFSTRIFLSMNKSGALTIPAIVCVQIMNVCNLLGCLLSG